MVLLPAVLRRGFAVILSRCLDFFLNFLVVSTSHRKIHRHYVASERQLALMADEEADRENLMSEAPVGTDAASDAADTDLLGADKDAQDPAIRARGRSPTAVR
jgi:hypothetical protein